MEHVSRALLLTLLCAACSDRGGGIDLQVKRDGCQASCAVDRFDLFVLQGSCIYAWRVGVGAGDLTLTGAADRADEVTVLVVGRCGAESCPRCVGQKKLVAASGARVEIPLLPVDGCAVPGRVTTPCTTCLPGPDAYCDGNHRVTCTASGQTRREACPQQCVDGRCEAGCQEKIFYEDNDGDTYGDGASQKEACVRPAGHAERGGDCDDDEPRAHPGQTAFFDQPTKGNWDFDFNCDSVEEQRYPAPLKGECSPDGKGGCGDGGWLSLTVPACGVGAFFVPCVKDDTGCSPGIPFKKIQPCR
jgi:hypothetical protein